MKYQSLKEITTLTIVIVSHHECFPIFKDFTSEFNQDKIDVKTYFYNFQTKSPQQFNMYYYWSVFFINPNIMIACLSNISPFSLVNTVETYPIMNPMYV